MNPSSRLRAVLTGGTIAGTLDILFALTFAATNGNVSSIGLAIRPRPNATIARTHRPVICVRIHEVHVRMNARGFGRSSIDYPRSAYYMLKVLLALFVGLFRRRATPAEATGADEPGTGAAPIADAERLQG